MRGHLCSEIDMAVIPLLGDVFALTEAIDDWICYMLHIWPAHEAIKED